MNFDELRQVDQTAFARSAQELNVNADTLNVNGADYRSQVVGALQARTAWDDEATANGVNVATVQALAFEAESARMRTGATALLTMALEMGRLKQLAEQVVQEAAKLKYVIEGGKVRATGYIETTGSKTGIPVLADAHVERYQAIVDEVVKQGDKADEETAKALKAAAYVDVFVDTIDDGNIVGRAQYELDQAYAQLGKTAGLLERLETDGVNGLTNVLKAEHGADEVFVGIVTGLFNQVVVQPLQLAAALAGVAVGDPDAQRQLAGLEENIKKRGLEAFVDLKPFREGRPGYGIGSLLGLISAKGKVGETSAADAGRSINVGGLGLTVEPPLPNFPDADDPNPTGDYDADGAHDKALVNGRVYSGEAVNQVTTETPEELRRQQEDAGRRAEAQGLRPGTPEYDDWVRRIDPGAQRIPVSVVQQEIERPGSTGVAVTIDPNTGEVTVVRPR